MVALTEKCLLLHSSSKKTICIMSILLQGQAQTILPTQILTTRSTTTRELFESTVQPQPHLDLDALSKIIADEISTTEIIGHNGESSRRTLHVDDFWKTTAFTQFVRNITNGSIRKDDTQDLSYTLNPANGRHNLVHTNSTVQLIPANRYENRLVYSSLYSSEGIFRNKPTAHYFWPERLSDDFSTSQRLYIEIPADLQPMAAKNATDIVKLVTKSYMRFEIHGQHNISDSVQTKSFTDGGISIEANGTTGLVSINGQIKDEKIESFGAIPIETYIMPLLARWIRDDYKPVQFDVSGNVKAKRKCDITNLDFKPGCKITVKNLTVNLNFTRDDSTCSSLVSSTAINCVKTTSTYLTVYLQPMSKKNREDIKAVYITFQEKRKKWLRIRLLIKDSSITKVHYRKNTSKLKLILAFAGPAHYSEIMAHGLSLIEEIKQVVMPIFTIYNLPTATYTAQNMTAVKIDIVSNLLRYANNSNVQAKAKSGEIFPSCSKFITATKIREKYFEFDLSKYLLKTCDAVNAGVAEWMNTVLFPALEKAEQVVARTYFEQEETTTVQTTTENQSSTRPVNSDQTTSEKVGVSAGLGVDNVTNSFIATTTEPHEVEKRESEAVSLLKIWLGSVVESLFPLQNV